MKILKILLSVSACLVVLATVGVIIFLKNFDLDKYRPMIVEQTTKSLGRSVKIDKLGLNLGWTKGVVLDVKGVSIDDDRIFSAEPLITVKVIHLRLDIVALITQRHIIVTSADIVEPVIRCIRDVNGMINLQTLAVSSKVKPTTESASLISPENNLQAKSATLMSVPSFLVRQVSVQDAEIVYLDKMFNPPVQINAHNLNVDLKNVALDKSFPFTIGATIWGKNENVVAYGWIKIDAAESVILVEQLKIESTLANIEWIAVKQSLPMLSSVPIDFQWAGNVKVLVSSLKASAQGMEKLAFEGRIDNGKVRIKNIEFPLENIDIQFEGNEKDIVLKQAFLFVAGGQIDAKGSLTDYLGKRHLILSGNLQNISILDLSAPYHLPVKLAGSAQGKFNVEGELNDPNLILDSLSGGVSVEIKDGKVVDFNLLKVVLDKISVIPDLSEKLQNSLPDKLKDRLNRRDTILTDAHVDLEIIQKNIQIHDVGFAADDFLCTLRGNVGFDLNGDLKTEFFIKDELSVVLVDKVPEFGYLLDDQKRIYFPFDNYHGNLTKYHPMPDLEYLAKRVVVNKGKEELKNVIFKALKIDNSDQSNSSSESNSQNAPENSKKELINNVLDSIFK